MFKVKDIVNLVEEFAPLELAYSWDNSGLITGDTEKTVRKVYLTLDLFRENIDEAVQCGADMIISHHPILFKPIQKIDYSSQQGYILKELIKNDIALYSAHTSMDCAKGGINDVLAQRLGLSDCEIIEKSDYSKDCGLGRIGNLKSDMTLREYAEAVKKQLNTPFVRVSGDLDGAVKRVAVGGGACDDLIPEAKELGADVMVTADMKYHITADSIDSGISVIDAGHFPTEAFVTDIFEEIIKNTGVEIVKSKETDVFKNI